MGLHVILDGMVVAVSVNRMPRGTRSPLWGSWERGGPAAALCVCVSVVRCRRRPRAQGQG
eukprot:scaffold17519_cov124-Isochrysis_galbana.AAC.2